QAVPVVADRVALPALDGAIELLSVLPRDIARRYASLSPIVAANLSPAALQPSAFLCSQHEYVKLVRRMLATGLVVMSRTALVHHGVLCVPKTTGQAGLNVDRHPTTSGCAHAPNLNRPTPDILAWLQLESGVRTRAAHSDLADCFWGFIVPDCWRPLFAL